MHEHQFAFIAAIELSKLPAKKRLTQLKAQQNAILNSTAPTHSSMSIIPINNQAVSAPINSSNNNNTIKSSLLDRPELMEQDDDEEINVDGDHDDSPLDMRITKTKHDSDDSVRPSVIRRAPSFKDTNSNSPGIYSLFNFYFYINSLEKIVKFSFRSVINM